MLIEGVDWVVSGDFDIFLGIEGIVEIGYLLFVFE